MFERVNGIRQLLIFGLVAMFTSLPLNAGESEQSSASGDLAGLLEDYKTFEASFIQIVVNENGSQVQESRGTLKAKRPGLFYWETTKPHSQFIASDGETVEVYDPDLEQVTMHSLDARVSTTPALLLSGQVDDLDESYRISSEPISESGREFTLEPRNEDSLFVSLKLTFAGSELQEMRMRDSLSQLSVLSFHDIRINDAVADDAFRLDYPDSVDVIRDDS